MNGCVVALGTFDGVHLGHRALIASAASTAKQSGARSVIYTFKNHPRELFLPGLKLIMTPDERLDALGALGVDEVVADGFDAELMKTSPADFAAMLKRRFSMTVAVAGFNYSFGYKGLGSVDTLKALGQTLGFEAVAIPPCMYGGEHISSTRIRACIERGDVASAKAMLGRPFALRAAVCANKHIGTSIGFPTANIAYDGRLLLPRAGVYAVWASVKGARFPAVTNIGKNPTVGGEQLTVETHLMGFSGDIYGETLLIEFVERLRPDRRFDSLAQLSAQIAQDVDNAAAALEKSSKNTAV